jgi:type I restriction enzyme R subunit
MRPIFSPSDFVQMKGRGTRKWTFEYDNGNNEPIAKDQFKLFDFFASCEYFEHEFNYNEKIPLRISKTKILLETEATQDEFIDENGNKTFKGPIDINESDTLASISEKTVGADGMRIDREGFHRVVKEDVLSHEELKNIWENGDIEAAEDFVKKNIFDKPKHFLNLDKIRKIFNIDRNITIKEFLQVAFGDKEKFETKNEILESEWENFVTINKVEPDCYGLIKKFFMAYIVDTQVRDIIKRKQFAEFDFCATFDFKDFQKLNEYRTIVPQYVNDYAQHLTRL